MAIRKEQAIKVDQVRAHTGVKARRQCDALQLPYLWATYNSGYSRHKNGTVYPQYSLGKLAHAARWKKFVEVTLPQLEQQLTEWEAANPEKYEALPWYQAREDYKAAKARGEVKPPVWWEVMGAAKAFANGSGIKKALKAKSGQELVDRGADAGSPE